MIKKNIEHIDVYTDGSCIKNKNGIKCGYGVYFPNGEFSKISRPFRHSPMTNQRAELYAIYVALVIINKMYNFSSVTIYSDSRYSIDSLTIWIKKWKRNNWKTVNNKNVLNQDIIKKIDLLMEKHIGKINFVHVRSHTGKKDIHSVNNAIVDELAKSGSELTNKIMNI